MAFVLGDLCRQATTASSGTAALNLGAVPAGYRSFVDGVGDTNTTDYAIRDVTGWIVCRGTVADAAPDTLTRAAILASSNGGADVTFTGTVYVYGVASADALNTPFTLGSTAIALRSTTTTIEELTLSSPTLSGTVAGTYTLGGTPTLGSALVLPGSGLLKSSGELLLGYDTSLSIGSLTNQGLQLVGDTATAAFAKISVARFSANTSPAAIYGSKSRGTTATAGALISGDEIFDVRGFGDDGATNGAINISAARIQYIVDGTVATGIVPAKIVFSTNNSAGVGAARATINASGGMYVGTTNVDPGVNNLRVEGITYLGGNLQFLGASAGNNYIYFNNANPFNIAANGVAVRAAIQTNGDFRIGAGSALATTATGGFLTIPACAGAPTGVPANAAVGVGQVIYDTTNKKIWVYDQPTATWLGVVVA